MPVLSPPFLPSPVPDPSPHSRRLFLENNIQSIPCGTHVATWARFHRATEGLGHHGPNSCPSSSRTGYPILGFPTGSETTQDSPLLTPRNSPRSDHRLRDRSGGTRTRRVGEWSSHPRPFVGDGTGSDIKFHAKRNHPLLPLSSKQKYHVQGPLYLAFLSPPSL